MQSFAPRSAALARALLLVLSALLSLTALTARAASVPSGFSNAVYAGGLSAPTAMQFAPDGRLFVCEQGGALRVIKNGQLLAQPFVQLTVSSVGERGLLGIAFDPDFLNNNFLYLYYTATSPTIHNRISRFTANGDVVVPGSEVVLMDLEPLSASNHNGGAMHFGQDGKLYVAVGDNANGSNAQTLNNRLGKMLRLNPDGSIPTGNPFFNTAAGANRAIWALGLRNPYTFAFRPRSDTMFINDVGEVTWEEINPGQAGANYGWPIIEGPDAQDPDNPPAGYVDPLYAYKHSNFTPSGCAITGGTFYDPDTVQLPAQYVGDYFFADYCGGWIYSRDSTTGAVALFAEDISLPVDLKVGPDGALYYLARGDGSVGRISYTLNSAPSITQHPQNRTVSEGQSAAFTVSAAGTPPLSYQWQRGQVNIPSATSSTYTLTGATLDDSGAKFRVVVTNSFGTATSNEATLTVTENTPPAGTIVQPAAGTTYAAGTSVSYSGTGTDTEDGTLPPGAFTWEVVFHHAEHTHPFIAPTTGSRSGSFTIPNTGETATDVFYRIHLTVRDSGGLTHTSFRDITPRTSTLTLQTDPPGLQVSLDGQPKTTPYSEPSVVGMRRTLGAPSPQTQGSDSYQFSSWSDRGKQTHTITTPSSATTYTARFRRKKGRIQLSPTRVSFADTKVGSSAAGSFTVRNTGEGSLQVTVGTAKSPFTVTSGKAFTLAPGASQAVSLGFTPTKRGLVTRTLTVASDDPKRKRATVRLRGRGR